MWTDGGSEREADIGALYDRYRGPLFGYVLRSVAGDYYLDYMPEKPGD
jgi:hypothetical protein